MPKYTDYKRDENGDRVIENGRYALIHDIDVVEQRIKERVKLTQKDWFLDLSEGVLYIDNDEGLLGSNSVSAANEGQIISQIDNTPGVTLIENFTSELVDGKYILNATVLSEFGTIEINDTLGF